MTNGRTTPLRVVQWATGNIGTKALRGIIEHPELELVGVYVYGDKAGRDAGDLCGLEPTGVIATNDADEIVALGADCVVYSPRACDLDDVCRLLAAGTNIVSTRGEFHRAASMPPADRERVEAACATGNASIHSTGSSPGFITEAVPIVLSSIQRRLDRLVIDEFADMSRRPSPELIFDIMGFGREPNTFDGRRFAFGRESFGPSLDLVAESLGLPLDDITSTGELAVAAHDVEIAAGPIAAGTVAAQRMVVTGVRGGEPFLQFRANWYCSKDLDPAWELGDTGWHIDVQGDAPLDVDLRFPVDLDHMAETTPGYTANRAVNAVALVCAADPGIRTTVELPQVIANLSEGVR
jgi:4-hydroxy-tetrahydrodipicolinate reductase